MTQIVKTSARIGLMGAAMIGLGACSMFGSQKPAAPPPMPPAQPATAPVAQVTIKDVQTSLQQAGYYKRGAIDGIWGHGTERAVRQFQHAHNLTANGKLDVPTLQALNLTGTPPSTAPSSDSSAPAGAPAATDNTAPPANGAAPPPAH
jgi:peptidoglycan hydrolase-like protein with peptidoglycan-binding domain